MMAVKIGLKEAVVKDQKRAALPADACQNAH